MKLALAVFALLGLTSYGLTINEAHRPAEHRPIEDSPRGHKSDDHNVTE